jgi:uncharacterized protein (TIGR03437 family)
MKPFEAASTINHQGLVAGLSPSPQVVNTVYIRCASNSDYVQQVQYRSVPALNPPFPRISSLWYGSDLLVNNPSKAKEAGLFLSSYLTNSQLSSLRALNPNAIVTSGYGATYSPPPGIPYPDSYLLKDIHGQPIEIYPQSYQMNLTNPEVAEFIANLAYQSIVQSNLGLDGIFFDSFSLNVPATFVDRYGNALQVDANGDGVPDDQATLNAAWRAGMLHLIDTFHTLMPYAYTTGHMGLDPDLLSRFSGVSLGFLAADAREGRVPFSALWDNYNTWIAGARQPALVNLQSAPPNQIAYGYGQPTKAPPSLMEFGRTFYPNMRFGLATALMNDGYFNHDPGDATTLVNWWYDEYDFSLGYPLGPVTPLASAPASMLTNGGFEGSLSNWNFSVFNDGQSNATVTLDSGIAAEGSSSARIAVAAASPVVWHVDLEQDGLTLAKGVGYELQFWARADSPRTITLNSQAGAPGFAEEGLATTMAITTSWSLYKVSFIASADVTDGRIQFWVGDAAGTVWLDGVQLAPSAPGLYRRDFSNGIALLNGTTSSQTFKLESGFQRFSGSQAPKYQYFVDDTGTAFTSTGAWSSVPYDSGVIWDNGAPTSSAEAFGPYYHAWQGTAHQLDTANGTAQWALNVPEDGQYTIQIWLPAAPQATTWTKNAIYEVVSGGSVVATAAVDQTQAAAVDGLHMIATVKLTAAGSPLVRVHNGGSGSLIADAVYVMSAALYNDGSSAPQVTLAPMDGILLKRQQAASVPASRVNSVVNAANFLPAIASAGFISIVGTGFGNSSRAWASSDFSGSNLPLSMDGISVTINGKPAYVEYISATQINAIVPDDDTIGTVQVIVNTPQGPSYAGSVMKQKLSPAFFTYTPGTNTYAAAVHLDGTLVGPAGPSSRPAAPGEVIEIYGTGFGPTNPALPTSQLISQPAPLLFPATISIGGVPAEVQFAGLVSSGLYQMNVKIPSIPDGDQLTQATVSGFQTVPNVFLSISAK